MGSGFLVSKKKIFMHCRELEEFGYPAEHPFNTSRAGRVRKALHSMGLLAGGDRDELGP